MSSEFEKDTREARVNKIGSQFEDELLREGIYDGNFIPKRRVREAIENLPYQNVEPYKHIAKEIKKWLLQELFGDGK